ncbi:MAG TPA: high-affinity branched-chain amino acid ABC transporter permease LivM [Methyloceanibacter sp.]|nr:high-affinity branched-chain amino acid ABC transporter permease LivM [Methyloceanibacter sp.]
MTQPGASIHHRFRSALVNASISALVAFALFCLILGVRTADSVQGLTLQPRPLLLAAVVGIVFFGRLALELFWWNRTWSVPKPAGLEKLGEATSQYGALVLIGIAVLFPIAAYILEKTLHLGLPLRYLFDLSTVVLTYVLLASGLNIVVGFAGLLDLGYVAFYAVGAYSFALLATNLGWSFWMCLPIAGLFAALWGCAVGLPVLRLRGDYLAIVTLAFAEILRIVLLNWTDVTNGPNGISGIPKPTFFGLPFAPSGEATFSGFFGLKYDPLQAIIFLYYLILVLVLATNLVTMKLRQLPVGRAWEALREDEIACRSLGINTTLTKLSAFATGAIFGGLAGAFFATRQGFISPESFTFIESATILAIVVLGGLGSQFGVALASIALIGGFEALRHTGGLKVVFGPNFDPALYRMLLFGLAMVAIMLWRPRGIVASRTPSILLKTRAKGAKE